MKTGIRIGAAMLVVTALAAPARAELRSVRINVLGMD